MRRPDAVADEHQRRIERHVGFSVVAAEHHLGAQCRRKYPPMRRQAQPTGRQRLAANNGDGLAKTRPLQRFEAHDRGLGLQITHSQFATTLAGAASFQQVVGKECQVRAQWRFANVWRLRQRGEALQAQ